MNHIMHLPNSLRTVLEDCVREGYPHETCGLLLGHQHGDEVNVCGVVSARNLNTVRASDRFEMDPDDFLKADEAARDAGVDMVGIWHSHPDHPATPSETDLTFAWEGWSYLILSVDKDGVRDLHSWRLENGGFEEERIAL